MYPNVPVHLILSRGSVRRPAKPGFYEPPNKIPSRRQIETAERGWGCVSAAQRLVAVTPNQKGAFALAKFELAVVAVTTTPTPDPRQLPHGKEEVWLLAQK